MTDYTFALCAEHLLSLMIHQFNKFRQAGMIRMYYISKSTPPEPTTPMTTYTGHTKGSIAFESQVALNNFKKGTKRDVSACPIFKNNLYYNTFQRSFWPTSKHKDFMRFLTLTLTMMMEIHMINKSLMTKNLLCILHISLTVGKAPISAISKRNSGCLIALSLILTGFQKLCESHSFRELFKRTMISG